MKKINRFVNFLRTVSKEKNRLNFIKVGLGSSKEWLKGWRNLTKKK